ncbi:hypothetical protein [Latilactobacillus curvatus]|uniref:Uncharacterized protein n=1 Tax=Latilactobacillus curvatus TaxID=28038 RepID=A0A1X7QKB7_LATCU|nr:hypothetical protein [Latilactobacillus curvatus]MDT3393417.1 hypothetical protein [Bacillota bacterium]ASN59921.1 hypothetical protein CG419_04430 [Latilactobacillus curvatus]MDG2977571.1 hypothetical protein [Latilactobacillus curvatus]MDG2981673.1 hypothetical protein [Latilactobacillus curvatus]QAR35350.1 hypothetical protein EQK21_04495 [Latilactobacillus curvatus]
MSVKADQLSTQEYIVRWNQFLERFIVFETVFSEYTQTSKNIIKGRCLVDENLESLNEYFQRNLRVFKQFIDQVTLLNPPKELREINRQLQLVMTDYVSSAEAMVTAFNEGDELNLYQKLTTSRQQQKSHRIRISELLNQIAVFKTQAVK